MTGMITSLTSELTMAPNAAPIMTPTARSTTLPFIANSRNSFSIPEPLFRVSPWKARAWSGSVDQARMYHRAADRRTGGFGHRDHRKSQRLIHLAEQRHCILDRRGAGFDEQVGVQRHQLVVQLQRRFRVALLPCQMKFRAQAWRDVRRHRNTAVAAMRHVTKYGGILAGQLVEILTHRSALLGDPHHACGSIFYARYVL